jgi:hypothetical protein
MTDNIVTSKSTMGEEAKPAKKAAAKKTPAKTKVNTESVEKKTEVKTDQINLIVFESGAGYSSQNLFFTRENPIQEVSDEDFAFLLTLENFRRADQFEIEEYFNSKED